MDNRFYFNTNNNKDDLKIKKKSKKWYIVYTLTNDEINVQKLLQKKIKEEKLRKYFGKMLIASEVVIDVIEGEKIRNNKKMFPGYILVEMIMINETWHIVKNIPSVIKFVGGKIGKPIPITKSEFKKIKEKIRLSQKKPKPRISFKIGEMVKIIDGPFSKLTGIVEDISSDKTKFHIGVLLFGHSTPVNLDFSQIEKF